MRTIVDGKELFYQRTPAGAPWELLSVTIATTPTFSHTAPVRLFELTNRVVWDVSPDGKRFLTCKSEPRTGAAVTDTDRPSLVFVANWLEELRTKFGVNR